MLAKLSAVPRRPSVVGSSYTLEGEIPAARVHALRQQLPTPTRREGLLVSTFERHAELNGVAPVRPRTDHNPLDRAAYVLVVRR